MVNIDERVMTMKFDNSQFRRAAAETIGDLGRLRESVKMKGATSGLSKLSDPIKDLDKNIKTSNIKGGLKGISTAATQAFSDVERSANGMNLSGVSSEVEGIKRSFLSLSDIASVALGSLASKGVEKALKGIKGLYDNTLGQIKTGGMARARNLEQANFMLGGIMETEAQVQQVMEAANASVLGTAYGLDQAAKAAAQFAASGVPIEQLQTSLTGIVGVAAMTSAEFDDIARIFTTVAGNGRVFATELNSIGARGINAAAALAKHFNVTEEEVRKMVSEGKVNFQEFSTAMATAFGPQAAKANDTYAGSLSNVRAALSRIGADTAAVRLEGMRDVFNALRPIINGVHNALKPFIGTLNNNLRAAFASVVGPMTKFGDAFTAFYDPEKGPAFAGSFRPIIEFIQDIGQVAGLVTEVLKDMVAVIFGASPRFIEMSETTTQAGTTIQHIFRKLLSVIMLVPEIIGMVIKAFRGTEDSVGSASMSILDFVDKIASFLYLTAEMIRKSKALNIVVGVLGGLFRVAAGGVAVFLKAVSLIVDGILNLRNPLAVLKDIVEYVKNHFAGIFDSLRTDALDKFIDFVVSGFRRIKSAIRNLSLGKLLKDFKIPRLNLKVFESVEKVFDNVRNSVSKVVKSLREIDWSPITSMFSGGFTMPSFGDIKNIGSGIGSSVMGGLNNLSWDYVLEFAAAVRDSFANLVEYIRGIDWAGIWSNIRSSFATGVRNVVGAMSNFKDLVIKAGKSAAEGLKTFGSWAVEALANVDWASVGSAIGNGIVQAATFIAGSAAAITAAIGNFFKSAIDAIDWGAVLEGLSQMVENVEGAFKEIGQAFRGENIDTSYLEDALGEATAEVTVNVARDLGQKTNSVRETIRDFFDVLFGEGPDISPEESAIVKSTTDFGNNVKDISSKLKSPFATAKSSVMSEIKGFGETIKSAAESLLEGVNIVEILNGIGIAYTGAGLFKLSSTLEQFAAVPQAISGALSSIGTSIESFGEAAKIEAQGNALIKFAVALGIMGAAVWAMSKIPWEQMKVGLGAVMTLLVGLVGAMVLMDKALSDDAASKLDSLSTSMMKIGLAVGILAAAIWLLGNMDPVTILKGLAVAVVSIAALAGGAALAGAAKSIQGMGTAFLGLAMGVLVLAGAFMLFKLINWDDITKGLTTLGVAVLAIAVAARVADGKKLAGAGVAMLGLGAGLLALSHGLKSIADINDKKLLKGLGVLAAVMTGITLMTRFGGGNLVATAGTLAGLAFSLIALSYAIGLIADIDFWAAAGGMAVLVVGLAGMGAALKAFPPTMPAIASSLLGIAAAFAILIAAIHILGNMDWQVLVQGGLAIAALTVVLGGLALAVSKIPPNSLANILGLSVGFVALAGSMLILAHAMRMFEGIQWESLGKAAAVAASAVAAFALLATIGHFGGAGLTAFGLGLAAIGGGLLVVAGAAWVFSDAVSKITDSMQTLADIGPRIKDALKEAGEGITEFANGASDGLRKLMDDIGFWDFGKLGGIANLFESFEKIPVDIGTRLEGLTSGLSVLDEHMDTLLSLKEFSGSGGNAKFLKDFFESFAQLGPETGQSLIGLVDAFKALDSDEIWGIMDKLKVLYEGGGDQSIFGNFEGTTFLKDFFSAFNDIDADVSDKISSVVSGLQEIETVWEIIQKLKFLHQGAGPRGMFGGNTDSTNYISDFFRAFNDIDEDAGKKVAKVASALTQVEEVWGTIEKLKYLHQDTGDRGKFGGNTDSTNYISDFFRAFNDIDDNAAKKVSEVASALVQVEEVWQTIERLKFLYQGGGDRGWAPGGNTDSTNYISDFFRAFNDVDPSAGEKLASVVSAIKQLGEIWGTIQQLQSFGSEGNDGGGVERLKDLFTSLGKSIPNDLGDKLSSASIGINDFGDAVPVLTSGIEQLNGLDTSSLGGIMDNIKNAFSSGFSDGLTEAAAAIDSAVQSMLSAITDQANNFDNAGKHLGLAIASGMNKAKSDVNSAGKETASAGAHGAKSGYDGMHEAGLYIAGGLAAGISAGTSKVTTAAREVAAAAVAAAKAALDIQSPSRVFRQIGLFVSEGLALGIDSGQNGIKQAGIDIANAALEGFGTTGDDAIAAGQAFADNLAKGMQNSPFNQRLKQLSTHAKAAHATAVKERKLDDMNEADRAEEERRRIYEEVEEARKAIGEAQEDLSNSRIEYDEANSKARDAESDKNKTAAEQTRAIRDAQKQKDKITDAERRYQKAIRERDKYEYRMHGEEAGVEFVDGVAVGLMSDKEAIPSVAEILAGLLMDEVDTLRSKVGDYKGVFEGLQTVNKTAKSFGDNIRNLTRSFKRLGTATSNRSIQRNIGSMLDSIIGLIAGVQDLIGVLKVFEPFLPSLLQNFENSLPAIAAMVAPFAPQLAASLGGGLAAAVPAILGPAGAIIAAVAGIGIFLWDQANEGSILKAFKKMFSGVGKFISKLPKMIVGAIQTLLKGLKKTLSDLPKLVDFILTTIIDTFFGVIEALPEVAVLLVEGIIDAILWVILNAPALVLELAAAIINGLTRGIEAAIKAAINIILLPFRWLTGQIGGTLDLVKIMTNAVNRMGRATGGIIRSALNLILTPFASIYNAIAGIFGLEKIGKDSVNGFANAIVEGMSRVIDFIATPFIGLWNFIAGIFGWRQLASNAASEFIFGTAEALDQGAEVIASAADRMAHLMDRHIKETSRDTLADVAALIEEQVALIQAGATEGVMLGGEATRDAANQVWSNIESIFDMYGLGKSELEALAAAFYQGTSNPKTMVSTFNTVFEHIQDILDLNEVGEGAVDSLNQSMIDAIREGMLSESMGEFKNTGYKSASEYVNGMMNSLNATKTEIKAASERVWSDIETVFDFYGLGDSGLEALKKSYQAGTENPETYAETFEKVFNEIERQLILEHIGTESVGALRTSMVSAVETELSPGVRDSMGGVKGEMESILSSDSGKQIGEGIVHGIHSGIQNALGSLWDFLVSPFVNLYHGITNALGDGFSIAWNFISGIINGFVSFGSNMFNIGVDIVQGIINGIKSKAQRLFDDLTAVIRDPIRAIKDWLGIRSPSRAMMEIGDNIGEGLTIGVARSTDGVADSMLEAGDDVLSAARQMLLGIESIFESEDDPVITPVLDLSNVQDGVKNMMGLMPDSGLNLETAVLTTASIASLLGDISGEQREVQNITNIEFNQTNTSPEALSEYEIYRNTERALDQVVLRNR